jgi:hypothetical protein
MIQRINHHLVQLITQREMAMEQRHKWETTVLLWETTVISIPRKLSLERMCFPIFLYYLKKLILR